eukprot:m.354513 g.354513  ORF g.354513 m.354513 type:complete len:339 (-) comp17039_c0_seq1:3839-4855(-)
MAQHSVQALMDKAHEAFESYNIQVSELFANRVLEQDPLHAPALELLALIHLQREQPEPAWELLQRAVQVAPNEGATKYMYLGQICEGEEAAAAIQQGLSILAVELDEMAAQKASEELILEKQQQISTAFCSLAEVYLTDLCEVDEAQSTCLALMEKALEYHPENVEALQTLASIYMSTCQPDEARDALMRSMSLWWQELHAPEADDVAAAAAGEDAEGEAALLETEHADALPDYEFRINTLKLLLELREYELAFKLADMLLAEDDDIMQVWYLQGWSQCLTEQGEAAVTSLQRALQLYEANACDRPDMLAHIQELLAILEAGGPLGEAALLQDAEPEE